MTSKESVLLFFPNAVSRRDQPDRKWRIFAGKKELSWGWRAGSAWNAADNKIRAAIGSEIYHDACATRSVPYSTIEKLNESLLA